MGISGSGLPLKWSVPLPLKFPVNSANNYADAWPATSVIAGVSAVARNGPYTSNTAVSIQLNGMSPDGGTFWGNATFDNGVSVDGTTITYGEFYNSGEDPVLAFTPVHVPANGYVYAFITAVGNVTVGSINYCY
jgi:hypothetical protein